MKKAVYITGVIAELAIVIGFLFKAKHLPGAGAFLIFATLSCVVFIPLFAIHRYRKTEA